MKLASFKRLVKDTIPKEFHDIIDVVGNSINPFSEDIQNALNKNLTVDDNLNMEYKQLEFTVRDTGLPVNTTQFKTIVTGKIRGITVERVENLTNTGAFPTGAPFITYNQNDRLITIQHITGLSAGYKYRVTLLIKG